MTSTENQDISALIERLNRSVGVPLAKRVSPPVSETDIRKWAIAVYYPETPPRQFWDASTPGGIVAPDEFNPFAWPIDKSQKMYTHTERGPSGMGLNAGTDVEYGVPIRPGDVISAIATPTTVVQKQGRSGPMVLYTVEDVWTNQRSEIVKKYRLSQALV